jgi:hypothetical protein
LWNGTLKNIRAIMGWLAKMIVLIAHPKKSLSAKGEEAA